jgi:hypothetical protein
LQKSEHEDKGICSVGQQDIKFNKRKRGLVQTLGKNKAIVGNLSSAIEGSHFNVEVELCGSQTDQDTMKRGCGKNFGILMQRKNCPKIVSRSINIQIGRWGDQ